MSWSDVGVGRASPVPPLLPPRPLQREIFNIDGHPSRHQKARLVFPTQPYISLIEALCPQNFISAEAVDMRSMDVNNITYHHGPFATHPDANRRVAPFLDALAPVAVSNEGGEVIAIALRLIKSNLELIISGNTTTPAETPTLFRIPRGPFLMSNSGDIPGRSNPGTMILHL